MYQIVKGMGCRGDGRDAIIEHIHTFCFLILVWARSYRRTTKHCFALIKRTSFHAIATSHQAFNHHHADTPSWPWRHQIIMLLVCFSIADSAASTINGTTLDTLKASFRVPSLSTCSILKFSFVGKQMSHLCKCNKCKLTIPMFVINAVLQKLTWFREGWHTQFWGCDAKCCI